MLKSDVGYLIKSINDKLTVKVDAELKQFNLTMSQCLSLIHISEPTRLQRSSRMPSSA